jgi:hypothetical protein
VTKDAKNRFLNKLEKMAEALYRAGDSVSHDDPWEHQKNYLWGYSNAGKTIELVSAKEIQEVIDRAHLKVFGEAIATPCKRYVYAATNRCSMVETTLIPTDSHYR